MFDNILGFNSRLTLVFLRHIFPMFSSGLFSLLHNMCCNFVYNLWSPFFPLTGSRIAESVHGCRTGCGLCCSPGGGLQRVKMRQTAGKDAQYAGENGTIGHFRRFHHIWSSGLYAGCPDSVHLSVWDICYDYS